MTPKEAWHYLHDFPALWTAGTCLGVMLGIMFYEWVGVLRGRETNDK